MRKTPRGSLAPDAMEPVTEKATTATTMSSERLAKLEPHKLAATFTTRWVRVDDTEYDITNFKHPGGMAPWPDDTRPAPPFRSAVTFFRL
jgi:hypothetical protein